jgi:chloramphenicol-sensitive protein RarD
MPPERLGPLFGASAYLLWGLLPLYWRALEPAGSVEILAHRFVWSFLLVLGIVALRRRWGWIRDLWHRPKALAAVVFAAVAITLNWATFIWGVNNGHVVETSLGYFINPIVTVALGVLVLREQLRPAQWAALGLAAFAVVVLTVDYGRLPWIALVLAFSFATYGLVKKVTRVGAVESLAVETAVITPFAFGFLLLLDSRGAGTFGHTGGGHTLLLVATGVATAVPLLFFGAAASRIPLSLLGLLQYIAPSLQFALGVLVFAEPMPTVRLVGFALVWTALVVFTAESLAFRRRQLRLAAQTVSV